MKSFQRKCAMCGSTFISLEKAGRARQFCGQACQREFQSTPAARKANSERQRKPIHCLPCLRKVGFGAKSIARLLRQPLTTVKQACRRLKIHVPKRHSIAFGMQKRPVGWGLPKTTKDERNASKALNALKAAFDEDWKGVRRFDDCNYWAHTQTGHPVFKRWYPCHISKKQKAKGTNYYISKIVRSRILNVLKHGKKSEPTQMLLGCTWQQFMEHLQSQFKRGMSWTNHGKWHIDHIVPCASFDLSDPVQQRKCFHYSNMRPMWADENRWKHDSIVECQPELLIAIWLPQSKQRERKSVTRVAIQTGRDYFLQPRRAFDASHPAEPLETPADAPISAQRTGRGVVAVFGGGGYG